MPKRAKLISSLFQFISNDFCKRLLSNIIFLYRNHTRMHFGIKAGCMKKKSEVMLKKKIDRKKVMQQLEITHFLILTLLELWFPSHP